MPKRLTVVMDFANEEDFRWFKAHIEDLWTNYDLDGELVEVKEEDG
jgi:hypothetical protein